MRTAAVVTVAHAAIPFQFSAIFLKQRTAREAKGVGSGAGEGPPLGDPEGLQSPGPFSPFFT
jgi:hypothetical protein